MKPGKAERYIHDKLERDGGLLLGLVDPDKQPFEKGAKVAEACAEGGADVILVGGSIGAQGLILDKTTKMIRERVNVPIILFPGNVGTITPYADAVYFMYVLNSREVYWVSTVQIQGAPVVKRMGIDPIPTGYIILEPGKAVGWISNANLIPHSRGDLAAATALAGEYMGARIIVTDSGSGAEQPAPPEFVRAVKSVLTVPYFYAGGCRTAEQATGIIKAGADGIQVGTALEFEADLEKVKEKVKSMSAAIKAAGREKLKQKPTEPERSLIWPLFRAPSRLFKMPAMPKMPTMPKFNVPKFQFRKQQIEQKIEEQKKQTKMEAVKAQIRYKFKSKKRR